MSTLVTPIDKSRKETADSSTSVHDAFYSVARYGRGSPCGLNVFRKIESLNPKSSRFHSYVVKHFRGYFGDEVVHRVVRLISSKISFLTTAGMGLLT